MNLNEIRALVRFQRPQFWANDVSACHTLDDVHRIACRKLPRPVRDYVDGGADQEITLTTNETSFSSWSFQPRSLIDVSSPSVGTSLLGASIEFPTGLSPTGYTRMISPVGEPAVARAAARHRVPYTLSTMSSTSLEDIATMPELAKADRWFQLYALKSRAATEQLVERAALTGYRVLEIAVDTAVSGLRIRDLRNGLTIPPSLTPRSIFDIGVRPGYWTRMLAGPALEFANLQHLEGSGSTISEITDQFDPSVGWQHVTEIRELWRGPLLIKGPLSPDDALRARDLGVDGVHLSNHGGRQLDRASDTAAMIDPVRRLVGDSFTVVVDSGVRHGADIATAVALGADAAFIGRPYLWGLAAGGTQGVGRVLEILRTQFTRTMQLLGCPAVKDLREHGREILRHS